MLVNNRYEQGSWWKENCLWLLWLTSAADARQCQYSNCDRYFSGFFLLSPRFCVLGSAPMYSSLLEDWRWASLQQFGLNSFGPRIIAVYGLPRTGLYDPGSWPFDRPPTNWDELGLNRSDPDCPRQRLNSKFIIKGWNVVNFICPLEKWFKPYQHVYIDISVLY
jgi:hypothetical protein